MALRVVAEKLNDRTGTVTVEGDTQEEVMSGDAKKLAIATASKQIPRCGVSGNEVAYPVDAAGNTDENMILGRGNPVAAYRCDYNLTGAL